MDSGAALRGQDLGMPQVTLRKLEPNPGAAKDFGGHGGNSKNSNEEGN